MPDSRPNDQLLSSSFLKTKQQQIKSFVPITACDTGDTDCPKFPPIILRKTNRKAHELVYLRPGVKEEHKGSSPGSATPLGVPSLLQSTQREAAAWQVQTEACNFSCLSCKVSADGCSLWGQETVLSPFIPHYILRDAFFQELGMQELGQGPLTGGFCIPDQEAGHIQRKIETKLFRSWL